MQPLVDQTFDEVKAIERDLHKLRYEMKLAHERNEFFLFKEKKKTIDDLEEKRAKVISSGQE